MNNKVENSRKNVKIPIVEIEKTPDQADIVKKSLEKLTKEDDQYAGDRIKNVKEIIEYLEQARKENKKMRNTIKNIVNKASMKDILITIDVNGVCTENPRASTIELLTDKINFINGMNYLLKKAKITNYPPFNDVKINNKSISLFTKAKSVPMRDIIEIDSSLDLASERIAKFINNYRIYK